MEGLIQGLEHLLHLNNQSTYLNNNNLFLILEISFSILEIISLMSTPDFPINKSMSFIYKL